MWSILQFHDTFGMGVANAVQAVSQGIRTIDASVAGIGGCPYSPGATGNVATEDILYALRGTTLLLSLGTWPNSFFVYHRSGVRSGW